VKRSRKTWRWNRGWGWLGSLVGLSLVWLLVATAVQWIEAASGYRWSPWVAGLVEFWGTLGLVALLWTLLWPFLGRRPHPISTALIEVFTRIGRGDFKVKVSPEVFDDPQAQVMFGPVFASINSMTDGLERIEDLRRQFVADVSHEFQSPLTSILGFTQTLKTKGLPAEALQYLEIVEIETRRLSRLSDNLLKLNALEDREGPPDVRPFRLDVQIRRVLAALEPQWSAKGLEVEAELTVVTVVGNEELWNQVWVNLVQNSVKFTPSGGRILVRTVPGPAPVVEVVDTGIGLTPEESDRVFERFYKADPSRTHAEGDGGSGLGLALVRRIVALHGGTVAALSPGLGQGTTVRVEWGLPTPP